MTELERLRVLWTRLETLVALKAPPLIKAHLVAAVIIPKLVRVIDAVPEFSNELARLLTRGLASYAGKCVICAKADAVVGDDVCPKCQAECDQLAAECGFDDEDEEEDDDGDDATGR